MAEAVYTGPEKLWNRSYTSVMIINTLNAFSFFMVTTILSKYLVGIGATLALAGVIVGLFSITSLVFRPFCGLMSDRLNNVSLLKWSNVLMGIGLLGFAVTTNIPLIIMFRIINGIGFAIGGTAQTSLATRFIPKNKMGEGIGYLGLGMVIGSAVAPGIGIMIEESFGMKTTFFISAFLTVVAYVILCSFHIPKRETGENKKITFRDIIAPKALPFTLVGSTFSFVNGIIATYIVQFADGAGIKGISIYFTVCAIVLFIVRPFSGKLMDKKGIRVTVLPGIFITACSMFLLGRSTTILMVLFTAVIRSLGQGAAQPSLQAGCINRVGRDRSGVATSTYYLGGDVAQGIGPMIGGAIIGQFAGMTGYRNLFDLCGLIIFAALIFFFFVTRKDKLRDTGEGIE